MDSLRFDHSYPSFLFFNLCHLCNLWFSPLNLELSIWRHWHAAAAKPAIDAALRDLYARLDAAVAVHSPTCWISGRCCKFDQFGHRLYVTGLEIAWFLREVQNAPGSVIHLPQHAETPGACPYQINGLCSTHAMRPLGCRIFFCQHGTEQWQHELYEQYLTELRLLHDAHDLDYCYMDWLAGLKESYELRVTSC